MDKDKFKDLIEAPCQYRFKMVDTEGHYLNVDNDSINRLICKIIQRTVRLTLQYPEHVQEYLDTFPKIVNESEQPTID